MPLTLERTSPRPRRDVPTPSRWLEVGGDRQAGRIALEQDIVRLGRGLGADLRFDDGSVSRRHAVLVQRRDEVRLLDDRSADGTFVNGRRVLATTLEDGDRLTLGDVVLTYHEA